MPLKLAEPFEELVSAQNYFPCISLLMPFEPKMNLKKELDHKLKIAADKIEHMLLRDYPEEKVINVIKKLRTTINSLNYYTHKKSIAIFISPLIEKVYYLDIPIDEKIIIDESFEIRDLIYSKKEIHKYLLAVLSSKWTKIYLGNTSHFIRITSNVPDNIEAYDNNSHEKIANFTDEVKRKEILLNKFLQHTDNGLALLLQAYKLPLFVMGTVKTMGYFKSLTKNTKHVIDYIPGNFEESTEAELQKVMGPYISDWKKVIQTNLLKQLDDAMGKKKLAIGVNAVWKAAVQKKGRLLVVEKNYMYPAHHSDSPELIYRYEKENKNVFYIKDAVDDIIEKVLSSGGDVEFVDEGLLKDYDKIALIEYYGG